MEKQEVIERLVKATARALEDEKPELIYAVVGALQRLAHAGIADEEGQTLVMNLSYSDEPNNEHPDGPDQGPAVTDEVGGGQE